MNKEKEQRLRELIGSDAQEIILIEGNDTTFIKEQTVNVHSGANFYNGSQPKQMKKNESNDTESLEHVSSLNRQRSKNVIDRIMDGVCAVYDAGIVQNDYEWVAVYKAIDEIKAFDKFSYTEFVELLKDSGRFKEGELPSASSISKITIKGEYPNWKVAYKGYLVNKQILDVGKCFFEVYGK